MRATKHGQVIELDRQHMMALIQTDTTELGEILTRAFILRRVELLAAGVGDIVLVGSTNSAST
jgi:thioredoxin reductase (NADPH)